MPSTHELRREYVLDRAIAAGKFGPARRAHWRGQYDRDPHGTEQVLAMLASATVGGPPYPHGLFPELSRRRCPHARKTAAGTAVAAAPAPTPPPRDSFDAAVAAWTRELFPETAVGAARARVTRCND